MSAMHIHERNHQLQRRVAFVDKLYVSLYSVMDHSIREVYRTEKLTIPRPSRTAPQDTLPLVEPRLEAYKGAFISSCIPRR
jgi:hypothetical protein